jgi:hypothetical protein
MASTTNWKELSWKGEWLDPVSQGPPLTSCNSQPWHLLFKFKKTSLCHTEYKQIRNLWKQY